MLKNAGYIFFILFALCVCISKAAANILFGVLMLLTVIYLVRYPRKEFFSKNTWVLVLLFPFAIGLVASFFSLMGMEGAGEFLGRFRFFLLILPFAAFIDGEKKLNTLFVMLNLSAFAGVAWGFFHSDFNDIWGNFNGLHTIGRNSDILFSISLMNMAALFAYRCQSMKCNVLFKILILVNIVLMLSGVMFMGRRGSLLGLLAGVVILLIFFRKLFMITLVAASLVFAAYHSDTWIAQRMKSINSDTWIVQRIKSIKDLEGNESNTARLQLAQTGIDYLVDERLFLRGTGAKHSTSFFEDYFNAKPEDYKKKYSTVPQYFGNFHNSFLQMAIEAGGLFLLLFLGSTLYMMGVMVKRLPKLARNQRVYPIAAMAVTWAFFVSQFFHGDLYRYGGIPYILVFSAGCVMCRPVEIMEKEEILTPPDPDQPLLDDPSGPGAPIA